MPEPVGHTPVLLTEVLGVLELRQGETFADATAGRGGHALAGATAVGPGGTVVVNDADSTNAAFAAERVRSAGPARVIAFSGNFAELPSRMADAGLCADAVLADLGFSSNQLEDGARGLSFLRDGPLDMRYDQSARTTAADLVNALPEAELVRILREFGEERHAAAIARKIALARRGEPILTTARLAEVVRAACPVRSGPSSIDPATRTFQALRIAVNDELGSLGALLAAIRDGASAAATGTDTWLRRGARVAIISFHSLEDRAVKLGFQSLVEAGIGSLRSKGPIIASEAEVARNPRSRSAKLRAVTIAPFGDV